MAIARSTLDPICNARSTSNNNPLPLAAQFERPSKEHAIQQHQTRFIKIK
jgi:hypothetical protein